MDHVAHETHARLVVESLDLGLVLLEELAERCAAQRHFLGYVDSSEAANHRNPYFLRQLMGFCMFHGCKEVALLGEADLVVHGVTTRQLGGGNVTFFA